MCVGCVVYVQVEETEKEREERLKQWESFLEDEGGDGGGEGSDKKEPLTKEDVVRLSYSSASLLFTNILYQKQVNS